MIADRFVSVWDGEKVLYVLNVYTISEPKGIWNYFFCNCCHLLLFSNEKSLILNVGQWKFTASLLTSILSESMIVLSLWAMVRTVHSWNLSRIVCWMRLSVLKRQGTQHLRTKISLPIEPWAGILRNTEQWFIRSKLCAVEDVQNKGYQGLGLCTSTKIGLFYVEAYFYILI